ncbi:MAG: hypothetical protein HMLKMBBP_01051 [Planctomycetes bacterium]|nr:hypothetical protein [Planctomycetota bacterium]
MRPDLLLVIVDALRADRPGFAGNGRARTPFLDTLAARGAMFDAARTVCGWTLPACASIVTGRMPSDHGLLHHDRRFAAPKLPALLPPEYETLGIGNNGNFVPDDLEDSQIQSLGFERRPAVWKRFGWQDGFGTYRWFHKEDKDGPFRAFREWWTRPRADARPRFAMLHTNVVHDYDHGDPWCVAVEPWLGRALHPALAKFRDGPWIWKDPPEGLATARIDEEASAKQEACLAECDRRLAEALSCVDLARTAVIVVSDHGEGFDGARQRVHHCGRLHDDLLRVPLVAVFPPGTPGAPPPGSRVAAPASVLDVAPTFLALAGGRADGLPGADLRSLPAARILRAEDHGYLYAPPSDVSEPFRRYDVHDHELSSSCEIRGAEKRIEARLGRQSWAEEYDLELDPAERINKAAGPQGPLRRPERDEGSLAAKLRTWTADSAEAARLAFPDAYPRWARSCGRDLPEVKRHRPFAKIPAAEREPITFLVAVDDPEELRRHVLSSAAFLHGGHQWLFVENRGNRAYSSISRLYRDAERKARHDLRFFVHQDVLFPPDWEDRLFAALRELDAAHPDWGVIGAAGRAPERADGTEPPNIGHWSDPHKLHRPHGPMPAEVQVLDELWLGVRASRGVRFDPDLPGFHCYGADLCNTARSLGMKSFVIDAPVVHKLFLNDGSVIRGSTESAKIAGRRTDAFRAGFLRSADYVRAKWARYLPFRGTAHAFLAADGQGDGPPEASSLP